MSEKKPGIITIDESNIGLLTPEFKKRFALAFADALYGAQGYQRVKKDTDKKDKRPA